MRAYSLWAQLALALALMFNTGCGDDTQDDGERNGGDPDGGGDGEEFVADTSGYSGRLTWNHGYDGIFVWDLPTSALIYEERVTREHAENTMLSHPRLSGDGSSLVYVDYESIFFDTAYARTRFIDLGSRTETAYPTDDLAPNEVRNSDHPTISADARFVAVAEQSAILEDGMPSNPSGVAIEVWDRETGARIRVTDGSHGDRRPMISADGKRVLFLSDRGGYQHDLYMADVEEGAPVERLTDIANDALVSGFTDLTFRPHFHDVSDDLRYFVFAAAGYKADDPSSTEGALFLLDTESRAISRIPMPPVANGSGGDLLIVNAATIAISGDGETLAFRISYIITDPDNPGSGIEILTAPRDSPQNTSVVWKSDSGSSAAREVADSGSIALSYDGSQIAYTRRAEELWINRSDGSDPRKVIHADEKRVAGTILVPTSLSF